MACPSPKLQAVPPPTTTLRSTPPCPPCTAYLAQPATLPQIPCRCNTFPTRPTCSQATAAIRMVVPLSPGWLRRLPFTSPPWPAPHRRLPPLLPTSPAPPAYLWTKTTSLCTCRGTAQAMVSFTRRRRSTGWQWPVAGWVQGHGRGHPCLPQASTQSARFFCHACTHARTWMS